MTDDDSQPTEADVKQYWWERLNRWQFGAIVVALLLIIGGITKIAGDNDNDKTSADDTAMEALRTTWNTMSASEQNALCLSVERDGQRTAARELIAAGVTASVDDVEVFLEVACD